MRFLIWPMERVFVTELNNKHFARQIFQESFLSGLVLGSRLLQSLLEDGDFLNIDVSQCSVATQLRCGKIFKYNFVANLPLSLTVKKFWKSVNIWGSYGQVFSVLFFDSRCIVMVNLAPASPHPKNISIRRSFYSVRPIRFCKDNDHSWPTDWFFVAINCDTVICTPYPVGLPTCM